MVEAFEVCGNPGAIAAAHELPRGAILETLVERHAVVFSINPKQLDRFRDRYTGSGQRDEQRAGKSMRFPWRSSGSAY